MNKTFEIKEKGKAIKCLICEKTSYNINDVENTYCGSCHQFHNMLKISQKSNKFSKKKLLFVILLLLLTGVVVKLFLNKESKTPPPIIPSQKNIVEKTQIVSNILMVWKDENGNNCSRTITDEEFEMAKTGKISIENLKRFSIRQLAKK